MSRVVHVAILALMAALPAAAQLHELDRTNHYILECEGDRCLTPTQKSIGQPHAIAIDPDGVVYFVSQNIVFKLTRDGVLTRFAGDGIAGYGGDGGPAVDARINTPLENCEIWIFQGECAELTGGIAVDAAGVVYVSDVLNHVIRRIDRDGTISTLEDAQGRPITVDTPAGLFADARGGLVYGAPFDGILRRDADGTVGYLFYTTSELDIDGDGAFAPRQAVVDSSGTYYFIDIGCWVRRWTEDDGAVTVAGWRYDIQNTSTSCGYSGEGGIATDARLGIGPSGLAIDAGDRLFVVDTANHCVRRIDPDGTIHQAAGTCAIAGWLPGLAMDLLRGQRLYRPRAVAVDRDGTLYVADTGNRRIVRFAPDGAVTTVAGNGFPLVLMEVHSATMP